MRWIVLLGAMAWLAVIGLGASLIGIVQLILHPGEVPFALLAGVCVMVGAALIWMVLDLIRTFLNRI